MADDPNRFLPTVQVGITLVSILIGTLSGAALGDVARSLLERAGLERRIAGPLGASLVVGVVTYLSIVAGELVPKRLALRSPEPIACAVAPIMTLLSRIAGPLVRARRFVLARISNARRRCGPESAMTDHEIHSVVAEAEGAGVIEPAERHMISGVMRLGDRPVRGVMTSRPNVDWLDLNESEARIREKLAATQHSSLPVAGGSVDSLRGVVQTPELLHLLLLGQPLDIRAAVREAPVIPDTAEALDALAVLRDAHVPMVLVHDESGHFEGVVTPADILRAIAGYFRADAPDAEPAASQRADGSRLFAGWLPADEMAEHLGVKLAAERDYDTAAGYVLSMSRRLRRPANRYASATGVSKPSTSWRTASVRSSQNLPALSNRPSRQTRRLNRVIP